MEGKSFDLIVRFCYLLTDDLLDETIFAFYQTYHEFLEFSFCYHHSLSDIDIIIPFMYSYSVIEARKGNPPVMPAVMTPGGPLDLSTVLFRNRIIFIGQPINSQVAQRVISQLVTLAAIDEKADILVWSYFY